MQAVRKGRVLYAAIQKFIAFIMSVHIAEVLQIFLCIVAGIPIMRQPLQILFLILCTDLPPAIALGMEPGPVNIMKDKPRPKTEPIVLSWMWQSIVVNGMLLTIVIFVVYLCNLMAYTGAILQDDILDLHKMECTVWDGQFFNPIKLTCQDEYGRSLNQSLWWNPQNPHQENDFTCDYLATPEDPESVLQKCQGFVVQNSSALPACTADLGIVAQSCRRTNDAAFEWNCVACGPEQLLRARTSAFISLVFSENLRAYTARSFDEPVWVRAFANRSMQKAIAWAQIGLYLGLFVPGLNLNVLELDPYFIGIYGWVMAFAGALGTVFVCEIYKCLLGSTIANYYIKRDKAREAEFAVALGRK